MSRWMKIGAVALLAASPALSGPMPQSDAHAVEIANRVMKALGGRDRWGAVQCIGWTIFGRTHMWNKWTGEYKMEDHDSLVVIMNVNTGKGRAWRGGTEVTGEKALAPVLSRAHSIWINDSYWFLMPYKLEDDGVMLEYGGEATTEDGRPADKLILTFRDVGDTPQNKYDVYVDRESGLVTQWSYYPEASDSEPKFTLPWTGWTEYDGIMLSPDRGRVDITGIHVTGSDMAAAFRGP